jgi:hypothetical protein
LIKLFDLELTDTLTFTYTGGVNITDKYGTAISMTQIPLGCIVDYDYKKSNNKLTEMNISKKAWEYDDVNNLSINPTDKVMKIASTKYKFTDDISILDGQEFIPVDKLAEQDELTVWGNEETIWSIIITKGHGTIKLKDDEDFIGANITIGYESMQQIVEGMEIKVREGTFNLTVENGKNSATKSVSVERNKVNYVTLSDLGPAANRHGQVIFEIKPFGADLYLDGEQISYSDPIELDYGTYSVAVSLGGYTTYEGTIQVDSKGKTVKIDLPEVSSDSKASVSETNTEDSNTADNSSTGNNSTSSGNPGSSGNNSGSGDFNVDTSGDDSDTDNDQTTEDNVDDNTPTDDSSDTTDESTITDKNHKIYIQTPIGASVYIDGDFVGITPCTYKKLIGSHVLTFIKDGYETTSYTVDISNDGQNAELAFSDLEKSKP